MPRIKHRASELYNSDLPFYPRREKNKIAYSRRKKHKCQNQTSDYD